MSRTEPTGRPETRSAAAIRSRTAARFWARSNEVGFKGRGGVVPKGLGLKPELRSGALGARIVTTP